MAAQDTGSRLDAFRRFLRGGVQDRTFVILDPSSYAAEFAGKPGGHPTVADNLAFDNAFPSDRPLSVYLPPEQALADLKWTRQRVSEDSDTVVIEETLQTPTGTKRRVIAEKKGTTPWLIEPAVQGEADFDLLDYYADCVRANAATYADAFAARLPDCEQLGRMPGAVLLIPFEAYYLVDYPDAPLFFYDLPERYLASIRKIHHANLAMAAALAQRGFEIFGMGSAGLELLSPRIFDDAIVPYARETTDVLRGLGRFSAYHICGHSRQLLETGRINAMRPTSSAIRSSALMRWTTAGARCILTPW